MGTLGLAAAAEGEGAGCEKKKGDDEAGGIRSKRGGSRATSPKHESRLPPSVLLPLRLFKTLIHDPLGSFSEFL